MVIINLNSIAQRNAAFIIDSPAIFGTNSLVTLNNTAFHS